MTQGDIIPGAKEDMVNLLPVSLLCGFLGAGKTTLLKHVLETKHSEEDFKCAVIVNDMAALNIDKSLIDQSALVQSDKVIAMQNGCFCCTLSNDLVDQIIELASKKMFNYMLIEASGVSEPSHIAPLFDPCDDQHDHEQAHKEGPQLAEVARLDTCVTVIDAAEFYDNLGSMKQFEDGDSEGTIAELMMEQVEFSNVVILNKTDLVKEVQQQDILERISILNPKVKVLKSCQSKINVMEILNTRLYSREDLAENSVIISAMNVEAEEKPETEKTDSCCEKSLKEDGKKCCKSKAKNGQEIDSGLSKILLGVVSNTKEKVMTRHEARFGITSFIYRARRPFHPGRLQDCFLDPFFIFHGSRKEEAESAFKDAADKQKNRGSCLGGLMRSKGFVWIATSQFFMGAWQQAGNIIRIRPNRPWLCEIRHIWEGSPSEPTILKELMQENGEEWPYGDRCQELVFIGKDLNHEVIQSLLDKCLLQDEEMEMGPRQWQEAWYDSVDKIRLPTKLYLDQDHYDNAVMKVEAMDEFEDMENMTITEVYEDKDFGEVAKVEFNRVTVTSITPQVATEFEYNP